MDFVDLGAHCSVKHCNQQDFLPFLCDGCSLKFCLKHRCYKSHSCKSVPLGQRVLICPYCNKGIPFIESEEIVLTWERHTSKPECKKSQNFACSNNTCKKIISDINSIICKKCNKRVCLSRYTDQHDCKKLNKNNSKCILF